MAPGQKTIKATTRTRRVAEENVPVELRGMYRDDEAAEEAVSLDFDETEANAAPEERENLFKSGGRWYTIPKRFGPGIAVVYMDRVAEGIGRDEALGAILKTVLGKEGWAAFLKLAEENRITLPQLREIITKVQERLMGAMEDTEGNS